jgi:FdrA protein
MPATVATEVRPGAYYDSVVLMQLQRALLDLPGVEDAGVVMGTDANKGVLEGSGLLTPEAQRAAPDDLVIVVRAVGEDEARAALGQVDALLAHRATSGDAAGTDGYRPKTVEAAAAMHPAAGWVLVSVPGRYAAGVARDALRLGRHVFLYSDNVSVEDEVALKQEAAARGLLVMGPDCGTAIVNGIGLGFADRVRRGPIGLVGASGTGLQHVTARIHQLGGGITHALGTGGRDLSDAVGAVTARQALDLLMRDPATQVVVLVSKPPSPAIAAALLEQARAGNKPVVVYFAGYAPPRAPAAHLHFAPTLDAAAALAVELAQATGSASTQVASHAGDVTYTSATLAPLPNPQYPITNPQSPISNLQSPRYLRALYSGGTLAYEAQLILQEYVPTVYANAPLDKRLKLENAAVSREHTVIDLGEDEFTVGRLHPMLDNDLRVKRIMAEAADPQVAVLLLDVVLGDGAHPDPAADLAPAVQAALARAAQEGRTLAVIAAVVGTDADPQGLDRQADALRAAGAQVYVNHEEAVRRAGSLVQAAAPAASLLPSVDLAVFTQPLAAINVGLASFAASLAAQGAPAIQVDWKPPAGGNERLMGILARMKSK